MRTRTWIVTVLGAVLMSVSACTGGGGNASEAELTKRLEAAQQAITDAKALTVDLSTDSLPDGISGLKAAKGRGYQGETADQSAFSGDVEVSSGGSTITAGVIAVDGKVYAKTGLAPGYLTVDPKTLRAPDPATLLGSKDSGGLPSILSSTEKLTEGKQSRDGRDVLTSISGELPGSVVADFLPTADQDGTFSVTYRLTDDDVLRDATISGPFYGQGKKVTYRATLVASDDDSPITAP